MEKAQGLLEEACASLRDPYKPASEQLLRKALRQRLLEDELPIISAGSSCTSGLWTSRRSGSIPLSCTP
ncbi:MAG: hypothetical protein ACUVS9_05310 [Thermaceae bacterium]